MTSQIIEPTIEQSNSVNNANDESIIISPIAQSDDNQETMKINTQVTPIVEPTMNEEEPSLITVPIKNENAPSDALDINDIINAPDSPLDEEI